MGSAVDSKSYDQTGEQFDRKSSLVQSRAGNKFVVWFEIASITVYDNRYIR